MSQITNTVLTHYRASAGNTVAVSQAIARGVGNIGRSLGETTRMSERLNNQWRAIGTTFRYAIAGSAVFGTAQLITNLKELQRQMGLLQALGNASGGIFPTTGTSLGSLLADARKEAVRSVTPINQFNEGLINLFSSVQNVPENEAAKMMREISLTAQYAQTDSEAASRAVTGMLQTFGMPVNMKSIQKVTRSISELIGTVPGGRTAGGQIFQQFPQLAASFQLGGGTPEQMIGYYMTLLRSGGTPATGGRGLQFLAQTLATPETQTKESRKALRSIGITSDFIEQRGVGAAIAKLIAHIRGGVSATGGAKGINDDDLEAMFPEGKASLSQMHKLGITGERAQFLASAIPRIHGVRAAVLLATRPETTDKDLKAIYDAWNGYGKAVENHAKRMKNLVDPQKLAQAQIAASGIMQQLGLAIAPVANLAASGVVKAHDFTEKHDEGTTRAMQIGLAGLAGVGTLRFLRGGKGIFGKGIVGAMAAKDAATSGGLGPGMSPQNPLYVIVVGKLFGGAVIGSDSESPTPGKGGLIGRVKGLAGKAGIGGVLSRAGGLARGGVAFGAAVEASNAMYDLIGHPEMKLDLSPKGIKKNATRNIGDFYDGLKKMWEPNVTQSELLRNRFGPDVTKFSNPAVGTFKGKGEVWLTIDLNHPNGKKEQKRVHVPLELWTGGKTPSTAGNAGSKRKN